MDGVVWVINMGYSKLDIGLDGVVWGDEYGIYQRRYRMGWDCVR